MFFKFMIFLSIFELIFSKQNNVCKNFEDYNNPNNNENCYYDPDPLLDPPAVIQKYAEAVEIHTMTSEDGYILNLFRIPKAQPKGVILIHHSIATSSHIYLWQSSDSLAITLWRNGFDVWLVNQRGTSYSDKHVNMTSSDYKYWNFSVHEMGIYDISIELEHIKRKTSGSKIIFIGHSLGSAAGLIYSSMKPLEAKNNLKAMVLLAIPCYFQHATDLVTWLSSFAPLLEAITQLFRIGSPLLLYPLIVPFSRILLRTFPRIIPIVVQIILLLCGNTPQETDARFFNYDSPIYSNNFSWKTLIHFLQVASVKNRFQMYDYGKERNMEIYGNEKPSVYPLWKTKVPTLLVSSYNDTLTNLHDSEILFGELHPEAKIYGHWKLVGLNHLDYHLGIYRRELFSNNLLSFLHNL